MRHQERKSRRGLYGSILAALALALLLCGCGAVKVTADLSAYADAAITVTGLTEEPFTITPRELSQMDCVKQTIKSSVEKVGTVTAVGPLLETLAAQYGREMSEFRVVRFLGGDGYKTVLKDSQLQQDIILSVASGSQPLEEQYQPLRVVIPSGATAQWTYQVLEIEFEAAE